MPGPPEPLLTLLETPSAFAALGLSQTTLDALAAANYLTPTPIQQQAIPLALSGRDIIGCAATGTGKTAAFLLPILDRLAGKRGTRALILAPTRELVMQIVEHAERFGEPHGLRAATIIGGASMRVQVAELRQQRELVVATPGRLVDHLQEGTARLDGIEVLVLDEADRMLDMGFRPQLERILKYVPKKRQTLLFSATIDGEVGAFSKRCLVDPAQVEIEKAGTIAKGATQTAYVIDESEKPALLLSLLSKVDESTLVFTRTQHRADKVAKMLTRVGIAAGRIHGGRTQGQRLSALEGFKDRRYRVLVATDIAARGIDVAGIGHVVIYDLSRAAEDHVHRVGRTARNESIGHASTFVAREQVKELRDVEKYIGERILRGEIPADLAERRAEIESAKHAPPERSTTPHREERRERKGRGDAGGRRFGRSDDRARRFEKPSKRGFEFVRAPREDHPPRDDRDEFVSRGGRAAARDERPDADARPARETQRTESHAEPEPREKRSRDDDAAAERRPHPRKAEPRRESRTEEAGARSDESGAHRPRRDDDRRPAGKFGDRRERPDRRDSHPSQRPVREWRSRTEDDRRESTRAGFGDRRRPGSESGSGGSRNFGKPSRFGKPGGFAGKRRFGEGGRSSEERGRPDRPHGDRPGADRKSGGSSFGRADSPRGARFGSNRPHGGGGAKKNRFGDRTDSRRNDSTREGGKTGFASKSRFRPKNRFRGDRS